MIDEIKCLFSPWCLEYEHVNIRRVFVCYPEHSFLKHGLFVDAQAMNSYDNYPNEIEYYTRWRTGVMEHFETTEANTHARNLILCAHKHAAASPLHVDVFPLDMLKLVARFADLIPPRDPLYEQRTRLIAWRNKPCLCRF